MPMFRKIVAPVEARRLDGTASERHDVYRWVEEHTAGSFEAQAVIEGSAPCPHDGVSIDPRDGRMLIANYGLLAWVSPGDWVVLSRPRGEQWFLPISHDYFSSTYEPIEED